KPWHRDTPEQTEAALPVVESLVLDGLRAYEPNRAKGTDDKPDVGEVAHGPMNRQGVRGRVEDETDRVLRGGRRQHVAGDDVDHVDLQEGGDRQQAADRHVQALEAAQRIPGVVPNVGEADL